MAKIILHMAVVILIPPLMIALIALLFTFNTAVAVYYFLTPEIWIMGLIMAVALYVSHLMFER